MSDDNGIIARKMLFKGNTLMRWDPAHSCTIKLNDQGGLEFTDNSSFDWHLMRFSDVSFIATKISLNIEYKINHLRGINLYVHHYGGEDIVAVAADGSVKEYGICDRVFVDRLASGNYRLEIDFSNKTGSLSIGSSSDTARYIGTGDIVLTIISIEVLITDDASLIGTKRAEDRLVVVDVGGAGGIASKWQPYLEDISPVLFEPNPDEASKIRNVFERFPGGEVLEFGLAHKAGRATLNIAEYFGCTSLLKPNMDLLQSYKIGSAFRIKETVDISLVRYDSLYHQGRVPKPDVLKIDVQGFEYEVLLGFGHLLETCIAVELEAHFYPIYIGQKLLHEIVDLLRKYGLVLNALRKVPNFGRDLVEVDAFFLRTFESLDIMGEDAKNKMRLIESAWNN